MRTGEKLGNRFLIQAFAGAGGMGDVYRAIDEATGRTCAVKILRLRGGHEQRFAREARLLADLDHPSLVRHVAHGTTERGEPYLAMQWIDGESLDDRLARGPLGVADAVALARAVASALSVAHGKGIVHRDLKPANLVLVDGDPARTTIIDFGIARNRGEVSSITAPGAMLGTPDYMAPEQARGEVEIDARSDVFALGCVIFACLVGRPPFFADNPLAVLVKTVLEDAPRLSEARMGVPRLLDQLVAAMLSKSPADRPKDAGAVLTRLAELGDLEGGATGPVSIPASSLTARERRNVCLVLARPRGAGLTRPGDTVTGSLPAPALAAMRDTVAVFGGALELLADGSLLVTAAMHGPATDQAARAARCALAVRAGVPDVPLALVVGQATWPARVPLAEAVDRALRLLEQRSATPGAIFVDDVAASLLAGRFDVEETDSGAVLHAERATIAPRTLLGRSVPCVGRDREIAALDAALAEVANESVARVVVVTGPAGIGKTRVCQEFVDRALRRDPRPRLLFARGDPMHAGAPLRVCAEVVRRATGLLDDLDGSTPERFQALASRVPVTGGDRDRVAEFLAELAGVKSLTPSVQLAAARRDPVLLGDQMRRAWEDWLAAEASAGPLLIWIDDLQWGDLPSVKFIDAALRNLAEHSILVLAAARPDVEDTFPELWADRDSMQLRMGELTRRAGERLVRSVLGDAVDDAVVAGLVERSAGNAFYLEELVRNVAAGAAGEPPQSVIAMVQARLESIDPDARKILRAASVFGQTFRREAVLSLCGGDREATRFEASLDELAERELIARAPAPGGFEYSFRHTIVREAAYAMLTDDDRVLGHRLAGEALEGQGQVEASALAEHFERGLRPGAAARWFGVAAEQALAGNDLDSALSRVARALSCLDLDGAVADADAARGKLLGLAAEAHRWRGEMKEAASAAEGAMAKLPRGSDPWCVAAGERGTAAGAIGAVDELEALAASLAAFEITEVVGPARVVAMGRLALQLLIAGRQTAADVLISAAERAVAGGGAADPIAVARMHQVAAIRLLFAGDPGGYLERTRAAHDGFVEIGDLRNACLQGGNLGFAYAELGAFGDAERALNESLTRAERFGLSNIAAVARHNLGLVLGRLGRLEEAKAAERQALAVFESQRDVRMECAARIYLADVLLSAGEPAAAVDEASRARERAAHLPPMRCIGDATLARALLAQGSVEAARAAAERSTSALEELGGIEGNESTVWLARAEVEIACGESEAARRFAERGRERLVARASKIGDATWRASFLERVPENAALLAIAKWLGSAGQEQK